VIPPSILSIRAYQTRSGFQDRLPAYDADFTKRIDVLVVRHRQGEEGATGPAREAGESPRGGSRPYS
jgi:hypothetical protein